MSKPNATKKSWYTLAINAKTKTADIYLYGVIGGWRVNIDTFLYDLRNAGDVTSINVYLNTFGGTFYDGLPIYNTLKQHKAFVTIKVMGYALSMGSVIMLAGDKVEMAENGLVMIHRAQGNTWGDAKEMRHYAGVLEKHEQAVIPEYMRRLGKAETEVMQLLQDETWYTSSEAKAAGLIDAVIDAVDLDKAAEDLAADSLEFAATFHNPPEVFASMIQSKLQHGHNKPWFAKIINAVVGQPSPPVINAEDDEMTPEQMQELKEAITASNTDLVTKLVSALKPEPPKDPAELEDTPAVAALKQEIAGLKAQVTEKDQKIAELSEGDPEKNTPPKENLGPAGGQKKRFS